MLDLDLEEILKLPRAHIKAGVYFLLHKEEIVYVGTAANIHERVYKHTAAETILFDSWVFVEITDRRLRLKAEADYIRKFSPKYNKKMVDRIPDCMKAYL